MVRGGRPRPRRPGHNVEFQSICISCKRRSILAIGGMLIFHPTYSLMNIANEYWKVKEPHNQLLGNNQFQCRIFNEPKSRAEMDAINLVFEQTIEEDPSTGAIYQGICRGKVSEGVDFSDNKGRIVVITGIPYAPMFDPRVKLKQQFLDRWKQSGHTKIDGNEWYQIQALRAVNQAIGKGSPNRPALLLPSLSGEPCLGRIIRHRHDFGAILFLDTRFSLPSTSKYLPSWVKRSHKSFDSPKQLAGLLRGFFNRMKAMQKRGTLQSSKPVVTGRGGVFTTPTGTPMKKQDFDMQKRKNAMDKASQQRQQEHRDKLMKNFVRHQSEATKIQGKQDGVKSILSLKDGEDNESLKKSKKRKSLFDDELIEEEKLKDWKDLEKSISVQHSRGEHSAGPLKKRKKIKIKRKDELEEVLEEEKLKNDLEKSMADSNESTKSNPFKDNKISNRLCFEMTDALIPNVLEKYQNDVPADERKDFITILLKFTRHMLTRACFLNQFEGKKIEVFHWTNTEQSVSPKPCALSLYFSGFKKDFIKTLLNRNYSREIFDQWLNNLNDFLGRWLSEIIILGCFSILSQEEHKKDFKIWIDEKDFYNKDTIFAANWILQAHRNGFENAENTPLDKIVQDTTQLLNCVLMLGRPRRLIFSK